MTIYAEPRLLPCGDRALSVELADEIGRDVTSRVLALDYLIRADGVPGIVETVPSYRALLVYYDPFAIGYAELRDAIDRAGRAGARGRPAPVADGRAAVLLRGRARLRAGGGRRAARAHPRGGRDAPRGRRLLRGLHRLHAGAALPLGPARAPAHPPPRATAAQDAAGQRQHRRHAVLHLLGGEPGRLLGARANARCRSTIPRRRTPSSCAPAITCASAAIDRAEFDAITAEAVAAGTYEPTIEPAAPDTATRPPDPCEYDALAPQRALASSAPRASVRSLAHTTLSATISEPANVPKPQSVDAMTRSRSPTASTAWADPIGHDLADARRSWSSCRSRRAGAACRRAAAGA